jgi:hypothetical protein
MYEVEGGNKFAARADDFVTVHRNTKSEEAWMFTEVHVDKVKTQETGGRPTPEDSPIVLRFVPEKGRFLAMHDGFHRFDIIDYHLSGTGLATEKKPVITEQQYASGRSPAMEAMNTKEKNYFLSDEEDNEPF